MVGENGILETPLNPYPEFRLELGPYFPGDIRSTRFVGFFDLALSSGTGQHDTACGRS